VSAITDDQLARAFAALGNPNRLKIFRSVLAHQRRDIGPEEDAGCLIYDVINKLDIGAPTVSHHVKVLEKAGLIRVTRNGKFLSCLLNEEMRTKLTLFFNSAL
tara:strand:+ start:1703 stop:2011 length:309 start_codon:yes stop_codon:yes gene_type:complete